VIMMVGPDASNIRKKTTDTIPMQQTSVGALSTEAETLHTIARATEAIDPAVSGDCGKGDLLGLGHDGALKEATHENA
jgi:hypothetical protein